MPQDYSSLYDSATQPLTTKPSGWGRKASDFILNREADPNQQWFLLPRAIAAGGVEGLGDLASSFTSPVNLAATALTGGAGSAARAGLPAIASGMRTGARAMSLPVAFEGARTVTNPNKTLPEKAVGVTQVAAGLAGARPSSQLARARGGRALLADERGSIGGNTKHIEEMAKEGVKKYFTLDELKAGDKMRAQAETARRHSIAPTIDPKVAIIEDTGPKWIGYGPKGEDYFNVAIPKPSGASGKLEFSHGMLTPEDEARLINEGFKLIKRSEMK